MQAVRGAHTHISYKVRHIMCTNSGGAETLRSPRNWSSSVAAAPSAAGSFAVPGSRLNTSNSSEPASSVALPFFLAFSTFSASGPSFGHAKATSAAEPPDWSTSLRNASRSATVVVASPSSRWSPDFSKSKTWNRRARVVSRSPPHNADSGTSKGCHVGSSELFTHSVL